MKNLGKITYEDIKVIETKTKCKLPDDYKDYLVESNGCLTEGNLITFFVEELNEDMPLDVIYGYNLERSFNLIDFYELFSDDLEENMIVIGRDAFGGSILLINQIDWKGIYYWDNSLSFDQSTEENCLYKICKSFNDFLKLLKYQ